MQKEQKVLKVSQKKDTWYAINEWLPELLLLLVDLVLLVQSGNMDSVAGVSVSHLVVSLVIRKPVSVFFETTKQQAAKRDQDGTVFKSTLSTLPIWCLVCFFTGLPLWYFREGVETLIGLPGIAEYLNYSVFSCILFRCLVVGYIILGMAQARMAEKVILAWFAAVLNYFVSDSLVDTLGVTGVAIGTFVSITPHIIVLYWAAQLRVIGKVRKRYLLMMWRYVRINLLGELPSIFNTFSAICLNGWLGPIHGFTWTVLHTVDDITNGLSSTVLGVGLRHSTRYHKVGKLSTAVRCWNWATKIAFPITILGALIGTIMTSQWYILVVIPCSLIVKWSFMRIKIPADTAAYKTAAVIGGSTHALQGAGYLLIIAYYPATGIILPMIWYCCVKLVASVILWFK